MKDLRLKIDLHVHTHYSYDSLITLEDLVFYTKKCGLDGVAITDHNRLDSALAISKQTDLLIVPGMEIDSLNGHIVALNIQEPVPPRLSVDETVERIHREGGIAVACHPTSYFKISLGSAVSAEFDAVEVINASAIPFRRSVAENERLASRLGIARVAGSDAHYGPEIGCAFTVVESEPRVEDVVEAIRKKACEPFGRAIPFAVRFRREVSGLRKRLR